MKRKALRRIIFFTLLFIAVLAVILYVIPLPAGMGYPAGIASCKILDRNGNLLREILSDCDNTSLWVEYGNISPHLINATITSEDKRFNKHKGIDPVSIFRALIQNIKAGRIVSGGSTITQQLAEITYHLPPGRLSSKVIECLYALKIEQRYTKKEILEFYLNRIPYSNQIYGIEEASRTYFDKPSRDLSLAQSAFLAAIPQSPCYYDPYRNFSETLSRQKEILKKMYDEKTVDKNCFNQAVNETIIISQQKNHVKAPHFCDFVFSEIKKTGFKNISIIKTTVDLKIQEEVEALLHERIKTLGGFGVTNGAVIVFDNKTSEIAAMVGSVDFWGKDGQFNASLAKRQPGSALKPFTYALAIENGFSTSDIIPDLKSSIPTGNGDFTPLNYDNTFHGPVRLRQALACSYNIPAVRVLEKLGPEFLLDKLKLVGFKSLGRKPDYYGLGLTLGSGEVTLLELVRGYSLFARGGFYERERIFKEISDSMGKVIECSFNDERRQVFSAQASYIITDILSDREARIPAFGRYGPLNFRFPCAAKTGTSKGFRDNWTVGYTPHYTVGVWVGNFDGTEMRRVSGITGAGPLFHDIMVYLNKGHQKEEFMRPGGIEEKYVCPASGILPNKHCPDTMNEIFLQGRTPSAVCNVHRMARIDIRTGCLADENSPAEFIRERVFEVYPPVYSEWMNAHNIKGIPLYGESENRKHPGKKQGMGDIANVFFSEKQNIPVILFPKDGDEFRIDPVLRREYQVIHFKAAVPENIREVSWMIDGRSKGKSLYPFEYHWVLDSGSHSLEILTDNNKVSKKIKFLVR